MQCYLLALRNPVDFEGLVRQFINEDLPPQGFSARTLELIMTCTEIAFHVYQVALAEDNSDTNWCDEWERLIDIWEDIDHEDEIPLNGAIYRGFRNILYIVGFKVREAAERHGHYDNQFFRAAGFSECFCDMPSSRDEVLAAVRANMQRRSPRGS